MSKTLVMPDGKKIKEDLVGWEFGRLTVIRYAGRKNGRSIWDCMCKCGNLKTVDGHSLKRGNTTSCGCLRQHKDITGRKIGRLTPLEYVGKDKRGRSLWKYKCDCGNIVIRLIRAISQHKTQSCGCLAREIQENRRKDLIGQKFGKLTVIEYTEATTCGELQFRCQCECGKITVVRKHCLTRGKTRSCGCLSIETLLKSRVKLVLGAPISKHYLYHIFYGIVARCEKENHPHYNVYGGRGITYDKSWKKNPKKFIEDIVYNLGDRPSSMHSLDRIDNDGNYEISNLQWADPGQQAKNQRCISRDVDQRAYTLLVKLCKNGKVDPVQLLKAVLDEPDKPLKA